MSMDNLKPVRRCWSPAAAASSAAGWSPTSSQRGYQVRSVDVKPLEAVVPGPRRRGEPVARPPRARGLPAGGRRRRAGVQPRRRHGRHGLHRAQQGRLHAHGADQHAPADGGPRRRRRPLLLLLVGVRLQRRQADRRPTSSPLREEDAYPAMPEDGYGWEKLFSERMCRHFEEDFGLQTRSRALPQRLRPAGNLGRRPREGAGRDLSQGGHRGVDRLTARSRSGATASRRAASPTSTTASTAPSA